MAQYEVHCELLLTAPNRNILSYLLTYLLTFLSVIFCFIQSTVSPSVRYNVHEKCIFSTTFLTCIPHSIILASCKHGCKPGRRLARACRKHVES